MSDAADAFENSALLLYFNATTWANVAINATSSPLTSLALGLHTADPGEAGNQTTNEIGYTSYARASALRSGSGFTVSANQAVLAAAVDFAAGTGGSGTATHLSVGTASSGTGILHIRGAVTPNIVTGNGVTPRLTTATAFTLN